MRGLGRGQAFRQAESPPERHTGPPTCSLLGLRIRHRRILSSQPICTKGTTRAQEPAAGVPSWGHSQGHIPAKVWVSCLWGFGAQGPIWSDIRTRASPGPASGCSHGGQNRGQLPTHPSPGLTQGDKRECSLTYQVDRSPWRTLQKKRLGQHLTGTRATSWGLSGDYRDCQGIEDPPSWPTLPRRLGPTGLVYTLLEAWPHRLVCSPLEVCALQEAHESYEVRAKASACHQIRGSPSKEPTSGPRVQWVPSTQLPTGGPGRPRGPGGPWRKREQ